jgi:tetratricopeptide (TPR) repeat protein
VNPGAELGGGRFRIEAELGSGTMGVAYRAHDLRLGHAVALKTLHRTDAEHVYELKREFRRLAGLSHPHFVKLYELFASDAECFFTMELLDGCDLVGGVRGGLAPDAAPDGALLARACALFVQLARGLSALHDSGQTHRDLKPSNVMLTSAERVVMLDFGLASPLNEARLRGPRDVFHGSLVYAAPEQFWGSGAREAADWYAVGAMLFEALTGRVPFQGTFEELVFVKQSRVPPRPSERSAGVPAALDDLVFRLLARAPEERPLASEVLQVLAAGARAAAPSPAPLPVPKVSGPFVGRERETARLAEWLEEVRLRGAAIGHVRGVSGAGKSELVQRFVASLPDEAAVVLRGRCHAQESVPYKAMDPLVDDLSHLLSLEPGPRLPREQREALRRLFPVLARVPELGGRASAEDFVEPQELRRRGFRALRELLGALAERAPLVLWIDDAQWGDRDSASLLQELLRGPGAPRILLLLTYRAGIEDRGALLAALDEQAPAVPQHVLDVGLLAPEHSTALVEQLLGRLSDKASQALKARIAQESSGSPFFAGELVRYLVQHGIERASLAERLGVAQVTMARVERLAPQALDLLELVVVAAGPVAGEVVLQASGAGAAGWPLLLDLCGQCLLREGGSRGERPDTVEPYHDRIRETLLATLVAAPERLRHRHLQLAETLLARPDSDPQDLLQHLVGAGDEARAAEHAVRAAEQAAEALAFENAAELFATAIRLRGDRAADWSLRVRRAQMLAAAGRSATAARLLEEAAGDAAGALDPEHIASLHGEAAEHYLYAGLLGDGTRLLREVLRRLDVSIPADPRAAMRTAMRLRLRFLLRGTRIEPIDPRRLSPRRLMRLDALHGAARGSVMLDHRLADVLAMHSLLGALELGEPSRALRALCMEASSEANVGGAWLRRRSRALLDQAEALATQTGAPYDRAVVLVNRGAVSLFSARFRDAVAACEEALELFRTRCVGAAWEVTVCNSFLAAALAQRGEVRALRERTRVLLDEARARGDRYSIAFFQSSDCVIEALGRDDAAGAIAGADAALVGVPDEHFTSLHFGHLVAVVRVHLYRGDGGRAWALIEDAWPRLRASGFLSLEGIGLVLHYLRGCAALAALKPSDAGAPASLAHGRSASYLRRQGRRVARRLHRVGLPTGPALALAITAGLHASRGERTQSAGVLRRAIDAFDAVDMALHRESARLLLGLVTGDAAQTERARAWMADQEVRAPIALARATIPGPFPEERVQPAAPSFA